MFYRILLLLIFCGTAHASDIQFLVMPDEVIGPISPYIYGINNVDPGDIHATVRRLGGPRMTSYNWVNNASNAGSGGGNLNDGQLCESRQYADCDQPGALVRHFVEESQKAGAESLITLPLAGYIAADKDGEVPEGKAAFKNRLKKIKYHKKKAYILSPNPKDFVVYEDEFVHFLIHDFKNASEGGVKFYDLDDEPGLWPVTQPRLHPSKTGYWELRNDTETAAENILRVDPTAIILGGGFSGWDEMMTLRDAPESKDETIKTQFPAFLDFYLDFIHNLEAAYHKPLIHALDLHWHPYTLAGKKLVKKEMTVESIETRLQAPRSLWDPGYKETSWITLDSNQNQPIQLIPWLRDKIDKRCPGTKLTFSDYDFGEGDHVSGGLAQADALGIFGKYGVFLACLGGDLKAYNKAAFKIFRNYNGQNGSFGDTAVSAATEDVIQTSCYAAVDSRNPGTLWVLVLNKNQKNSVHGKFKFQGRETYKTYEAYAFDSHSPEIKPVKKGGVDKGGFDYSLPPLSATIFVCR